MEVDFVASRDAGKLRLWAVDLSVCPTASLSGFQLFDFLAAGQFDPATGTYWVPGMPEMPEIPAMAPNQPSLQQAEGGHSAAAVEKQQNEAQSAMQLFEPSMQQDAVMLEEERCSYPEAAVTTAILSHQSTEAEPASNSRQLSAQSKEADGVDEVGRQSSVLDPNPSTVTADAPEEAECRQDAAVGSATAASLNAASTHLLNQLSDKGLEPDSTEADSGLAASSGSSQEQSMGDVASMNSQIAGQMQAERLGNNAAMWQQPDAMMQQEMQLESRFYAAIDLLFHSGMHKRRSAEFLQNCRVAGLGFDMMERQGLVLNFMDSMSSCCLGVQCAGPTPQLALQGLSKVIVMICIAACTLCSCPCEVVQCHACLSEWQVCSSWQACLPFAGSLPLIMTAHKCLPTAIHVPMVGHLHSLQYTTYALGPAVLLTAGSQFHAGAIR